MKNYQTPALYACKVSLCATALLALRFVPVLSAQQTPTPAEVAQAGAADDIVKLDVFNVSGKIDSYHEETSSMASKVPTSLKELPLSLEILNASSISDHNAVTLTDLFNYVVGATSSQNAINGFSFRGFPNTGSYTQNIQFDGLMGATLKKAGASATNVDSLEFLKGPNGVLYGQMNPGGLLNIITKDPKEISQTTFRFTVASFAGAFDTIGSKFTETASLDTTGAVGNSKHMFFRMIIDIANAPTSRPGNTDHTISFFPSITYKWSKDTYLKVKVESASDFRRQDDGIIPIFTNGTAYGTNAKYYTAPLNTVYNDSTDKATDRGEALSINFNSKLADSWVLRFQTRSVWHLDVVREFTVNNANVFSPTAKFGSPNSLLRRQYNYVKNGHRYNYGDLNLLHTFGNQNYKDTVIAGLGGGGEFFGNSRLAFGPNTLTTQTLALVNPVLNQYSYPADGTGVTNQLTNQTAFGEYISDQLAIGDKLHISAGLRHDMQKIDGLNTLQPGLTLFRNKLLAYTKQFGVVYDVTSNISPYASYSQSIKPQTNIAFDNTGNSSFPPETGKQIEGGIKFENTAKTMDMTVAVYDIKRSNVVVASGTTFTVATGNAQVGQAISRLDGGQESKGYEFEARWQPVTNWQVQLGYAYSKATISASLTNPATIGLDLANAPRKSGNLWTRYNLPKGALQGLGIGGGLIYVGQAWAGDPTTTVYYNLSGYVRADTAIYYKWKKYDLSLNVQNLFDRRYISGAQSALTLNAGEERKLTFSMTTHF